MWGPQLCPPPSLAGLGPLQAGVAVGVCAGLRGHGPDSGPSSDWDADEASASAEPQPDTHDAPNPKNSCCPVLWPLKAGNWLSPNTVTARKER